MASPQDQIISQQQQQQQHGGIIYTVIDENVVKDALEQERDLESKAKAEANGRAGTADQRGISNAPHEEEIRLEEVECLRLSYQNILKIDNLVGLRSLTSLCLDNNVLTEIVNLGHLTNLKWLDLSFNNITSIKGLENLTELKDLSLYSNQIETIENLDQLTKLECLSLGRNRITKLEDILYLRQFKTLRLVTLEGNPVCKDPEYKMYILAYLEHLKYLDYALIEKSDVISAREQYQDELLEAEEREALEEANEKAAQQHREFVAKLKIAHLEIVETLFTDMFSEDKELPKLKLLPGFDTIMDSYQHEFRVQAEGTINIGLEIHARFVKECDRVEEAIDKVTHHNESTSIELAEAFNKSKKKVATAVQAYVKMKQEESQLNSQRRPNEDDGAGLSSENSLTQEECLRKLEELEKHRLELRQNLMTIEIQQVQQLKKLADVYENRAGNIRSDRVDQVTNFFRAVEDLENSFASALEELAQTLIEKLANNMLEDLSDDTIAFLSDRDNLMVAIQGAHDVHLGKLLAQEDAIRDRINKELSDKVSDMKKRFNQQNRNRVFEINKMHQNAKGHIQEMIQDVSGADDEEHF